MYFFSHSTWSFKSNARQKHVCPSVNDNSACMYTNVWVGWLSTFETTQLLRFGECSWTNTKTLASCFCCPWALWIFKLWLPRWIFSRKSSLDCPAAAAEVTRWHHCHHVSPSMDRREVRGAFETWLIFRRIDNLLLFAWDYQLREVRRWLLLVESARWLVSLSYSRYWH